MSRAPAIELTGETVLITGTGRGIGKGIARTLARWGAAVIVTDIDGETAAETLRLIEQAGGKGWSYALDVTNESAIEQVVEESVRARGRIDLLVNNAGILSVSAMTDMTSAAWRRVMEVNATGVFLVTRAVARRMRERKAPASIVSIASIAGKRGYAGISHYCASKFAVIGFTQAIAQELAGDDICVNAICPGLVETPMLSELSAGSGEAIGTWVEQQAIKRTQTPEDLALAIASLHRLRAVTGQAINVDGGSLFH